MTTISQDLKSIATNLVAESSVVIECSVDVHSEETVNNHDPDKLKEIESDMRLKLIGLIHKVGHECKTTSEISQDKVVYMLGSPGYIKPFPYRFHITEPSGNLWYERYVSEIGSSGDVVIMFSCMPWDYIVLHDIRTGIKYAIDVIKSIPFHNNTVKPIQSI